MALAFNYTQPIAMTFIAAMSNLDEMSSTLVKYSEKFNSHK